MKNMCRNAGYMVRLVDTLSYKAYSFVVENIELWGCSKLRYLFSQLIGCLRKSPNALSSFVIQVACWNIEQGPVAIQGQKILGSLWFMASGCFHGRWVWCGAVSVA